MIHVHSFLKLLRLEKKEEKEKEGEYLLTSGFRLSRFVSLVRSFSLRRCHGPRPKSRLHTLVRLMDRPLNLSSHSRVFRVPSKNTSFHQVVTKLLPYACPLNSIVLVMSYSFRKLIPSFSLNYHPQCHVLPIYQRFCL